MVPFAVRSGCSAVGMGCKVVEFNKPFVRAGGHFVSPGFASLDRFDVWLADPGYILAAAIDEGEELDRR
jgi:hypothetical protein